MIASSNDSKLMFESINRGYNSVFSPKRLSIGLVAPIENYSAASIPTMKHHIERVQLAEQLDFSAVWLRDVPFNVPAFGDAGQVFDPFVYLGLLAGVTSEITLGVASIVLPLRHPAHVAKAAASVDNLSGGRLVLGIASGDRPDEYPAMNLSYSKRGQRFRDSFDYIRSMAVIGGRVSNEYGDVSEPIKLLPKPVAGKLPLLITGGSQQSPEWLAKHGDGWMTYPRPIESQAQMIKDLREQSLAMVSIIKPVMQPLYIDLVENDDTPPEPIHLGFRSGMNYLVKYARKLEVVGVNHLALNLRFNQANIETTLNRLGAELVPEFSN